MRTVNLRENFTEDKYTNLYEVQTAVNKIYNLALENNLGKDIIFEWQQHVIVVQSLVDNLAHNPKIESSNPATCNGKEKMAIISVPGW